MKICAASATPGSFFTSASRLCGRTERVRSDAPCWKRPKSDRPTWINCFAVSWTPAVIESSATISPTPIATPATVSAVRAFLRIRFLSTRPDQVTGAILSSTRLRRMTPDRDAILKALENVIDPELQRPVTELDMVRDVEIDGGDVSVTIALTVAGCPLRDSFQDQVTEHVGKVPGVERVRLGFDVMSPEERSALSVKLRGGVEERSKGISVDRSTRVLAVASGKGGVGKSSLTVNLAAAFSQLGHRTGVIDADIYGHSIPHMLGVHQKPVVVDKMIVPPVKNGLKLMSIGFFLDDNGPVMWRGPMLHRALEQFLSDVHWGELDLLLVDMPPGTGDVSISLGQLLPRAEAVIVTTPQPLAQEVASRAAVMAQKTNMRLIGVIENMTSDVFGSGGGERLAEQMGVPLLGKVPLDARLRECGDEGEPLVWAEPESETSLEIVRIAEAIHAGRQTFKALPVLS